MESRYLYDIMSEMLTATIDFAIKFFQISSTNLIVQSNTISHMLAHFGHNLAESSNELNYNTTAAYFDCVTEWIVATGANSNFYKYSTSILDNLLNRIKPFQKFALSVRKFLLLFFVFIISFYVLNKTIFRLSKASWRANWARTRQVVNHCTKRKLTLIAISRFSQVKSLFPHWDVNN